MPTSLTAIISRVGASTEAGGIFAVVHTLAQPAWLDEAASADDRSGTVQPMTKGLGGLAPSLRDVVLVLRGLFVSEALATDHGTWMLRASAAEPDIVRVEVRAGARADGAVGTLVAHLAARRELERVLEAGGPLPSNPDVLLPVTRTLNYRAPLRAGDTFQVELEDFATGWLDRGQLKDIPQAVRRAWHLAWSRRGRSGAP